MPASQHQKPLSDIEIAQAAKKRPILELAKEKLGISPENLEPYGHYKAKLSMDFIKSLKNKPNGKLILVSAINPTPAGEGKTTTSIGLAMGMRRSAKRRAGGRSRCASRRSVRVRREGRRHRRRRRRRSCRRRGHQPALHRRYPRDHVGATTCCRRSSTTTCYFGDALGVGFAPRHLGARV